MESSTAKELLELLINRVHTCCLHALYSCLAGIFYIKLWSVMCFEDSVLNVFFHLLQMTNVCVRMSGCVIWL